MSERMFTCAACERAITVEFNEGGAFAREWKTHIFTKADGRIDKVVTVYSCSTECARRIASPPPTQIVDEALDWLGGEA